MSEQEAANGAERPLVHSRVARLWLKELPYLAVLLLTLLGVAYTSISHQPLIGYWEFLALAMGVVCIGTGWLHTQTKQARFRMVWTQALHWLAFLVAMNITCLIRCSKTAHRARNGARASDAARAWHFRRGCSYRLADLRTRSHHGTFGPRDRMAHVICSLFDPNWCCSSCRDCGDLHVAP